MWKRQSIYRMLVPWLALAESKKRKKYEELSTIHEFAPVAIETTGVLGPETVNFIHDLKYSFE